MTERDHGAGLAPSCPIPDRRILSFYQEDENGFPKALSFARMASTAASWPTTDATPANVANLLATSRSLYVLSWYRYELLIVAVAWSLLAVETALRHSLGASVKKSFVELLQSATQKGLLAPELAEQLDAGRRIRNMLLHPGEVLPLWPPAMARPALAVAHRVIADLNP